MVRPYSMHYLRHENKIWLIKIFNIAAYRHNITIRFVLSWQNNGINFALLI